MPFCSNCGKTLRDDERFCPNCGAAVASGSAAQAAQPAPAVPGSKKPSRPTLFKAVCLSQLIVGAYILALGVASLASTAASATLTSAILLILGGSSLVVIYGLLKDMTWTSRAGTVSGGVYAAAGLVLIIFSKDLSGDLLPAIFVLFGLGTTYLLRPSGVAKLMVRS